jgi:hypothetical protein
LKDTAYYSAIKRALEVDADNCARQFAALEGWL